MAVVLPYFLLSCLFHFLIAGSLRFMSFLPPLFSSDPVVMSPVVPPPGKRKALKLNFANPPIKPTARFTLNTAGPPFQNPHM